jgi:SAM-dependent methyltransferase
MAEFARLLERVELWSGAGRRLLDVGCSTGELIEVAQSRGWDCEGIEIDRVTASVAEEITGARVRLGTIGTALGPDDRFDLIVMSHSLEHTPTPRLDIECLASHLTKNGRALVRVPNADSLSAKLMGSGWYWFIPPTHISYFSRRSIVGVCTEIGLTELWCEERGEGWVKFLSEFLTMPLLVMYRRTLSSRKSGGDVLAPKSLRGHPSGQGPASAARRALAIGANWISSNARLLRPSTIFVDSEISVLLSNSDPRLPD